VNSDEDEAAGTLATGVMAGFLLLYTIVSLTAPRDLR